jgi:uncharacterized protein
MAEHATLVDRFAAFGHEMRTEGLPVGSDDIVTYCSAVAALDPSDMNDLYWAGRATLVTRRDQIPIYDSVFRRFFLGIDDEPSDPPAPPRATPSTTQAVLQIPDSELGSTEGENDDREDTPLGLLGSDADIWRDKAFSACTPEELSALRRIMDQVRLTPPQRRSRRRCADNAGQRLDMRRTVRETMRMHREPPHLFRVGRKSRTRPLVLILDVSGSMSDYSRNLLQFAYSAKRAARRVEVFCFGTRLTRITPALDRRRPDDAMEYAGRQVFDWDGGTRIGESLDAFVRGWGRRGLSRGAIVVICSDGLDRGDPAVLAGAMERLSRLCHRIVWMNPNKRDDPDFEPNTLGLMVAAPYIDSMVSGHNLASLEDFATHLPELR